MVVLPLGHLPEGDLGGRSVDLARGHRIGHLRYHRCSATLAGGAMPRAGRIALLFLVAVLVSSTWAQVAIPRFGTRGDVPPWRSSRSLSVPASGPLAALT